MTNERKVGGDGKRGDRFQVQTDADNRLGVTGKEESGVKVERKALRAAASRQNSSRARDAEGRRVLTGERRTEFLLSE